MKEKQKWMEIEIKGKMREKKRPGLWWGEREREKQEHAHLLQADGVAEAPWERA